MSKGSEIDLGVITSSNIFLGKKRIMMNFYYITQYFETLL